MLQYSHQRLPHTSPDIHINKNMKRTTIIFFLLPAVLLSACLFTPEVKRSGCVVGSIPDTATFDPFYAKYCDGDGIPIISSENVPNLALQQAYYIIMNMLAPVPDIHQELVSNGVYFVVIGREEALTEIPEYSHMDSDYWDSRARGLGGDVVSAAEENLLCFSFDPYHGESIAVHEFAHTISLFGLGENFDTLLQEFTGLYDSAIERGLWENTYAISDIEEYWAEGVQCYFNTNLEAIPTDGVHNAINTREELEAYDPALYAFIDRIFNGHDWTPICPEVK